MLNILPLLPLLAVTHASEQPPGGSSEYTCAAQWAALASLTGEPLEVRCLAQGHFNHDRPSLGIKPLTFKSQALFPAPMCCVPLCIKRDK